MTWSSTGTLSGTMGTGAASTATTRPGAWVPPAAAAASAPTRSRWVVLRASCVPRLAGVCRELTSLFALFCKSQVYRSRSGTAGPYEAPPPPGSFHGDYAYDTYSAQGFPEYGYPADAGWPAVEQGVCGRGPGRPQVSAGRRHMPVVRNGEV